MNPIREFRPATEQERVFFYPKFQNLIFAFLYIYPNIRREPVFSERFRTEPDDLNNEGTR